VVEGEGSGRIFPVVDAAVSCDSGLPVEDVGGASIAAFACVAGGASCDPFPADVGGVSAELFAFACFGGAMAKGELKLSGESDPADEAVAAPAGEADGRLVSEGGGDVSRPPPGVTAASFVMAVPGRVSGVVVGGLDFDVSDEATTGARSSPTKYATITATATTLAATMEPRMNAGRRGDLKPVPGAAMVATLGAPVFATLGGSRCACTCSRPRRKPGTSTVRSVSGGDDDVCSSVPRSVGGVSKPSPDRSGAPVRVSSPRTLVADGDADAASNEGGASADEAVRNGVSAVR